MVNKLEDFTELNLSSFIKVVELLKQTIEISDILVNDKISVPKKKILLSETWL
ncbi:MAG: hypothetical protein LBU33_02005 [Endomicrobium sp.]|jgi:hypothetical protein|nr:hypothetical protein [Endomicrobium sp.]